MASALFALDVNESHNRQIFLCTSSFASSTLLLLIFFLCVCMWFFFLVVFLQMIHSHIVVTYGIMYCVAQEIVVSDGNRLCSKFYNCCCGCFFSSSSSFSLHWIVCTYTMFTSLFVFLRFISGVNRFNAHRLEKCLFSLRTFFFFFFFFLLLLSFSISIECESCAHVRICCGVKRIGHLLLISLCILSSSLSMSSHVVANVVFHPHSFFFFVRIFRKTIHRTNEITII